MPPLPNSDTFHIGDVVDIDILQRIQDTFAQAMEVGAVTVDRSGKPVTKNSNFQPICKCVRATPDGLARCQASDAEGGRVAYELDSPYSYVCGGGLLDAAAPITVGGQYVGSILCGQVIPVDNREQFIEGIVERNVALGMDAGAVRDLAEKIPVVPRRRFQAAVEMLSVVANYIIQMGAAKLAQEKVLEEAREKARLQAALQEAQLRALKAQINPHFLFNSLTLIAYTAMAEQAPRTEEIAYILGDLLRYSLRSMNTSVALGEEMEMIEHYLAIQQVRFGQRLRWQIDLDPALDKARIPCMILQPLVENSVLHAAEPITRPVTISVEGSRENGRVCLAIADDGAGMKPEMVAAINQRQFPTSGKRPSLGLQNVIQRLEGEYGNDSQLQVQSKPGTGTRISLSFPFHSEEHV